jgi:hypothetical protein
MAIIDLRHLVDSDYDTIKITGSEDKKDYDLPCKKTVEVILNLQKSLQDYKQRIDENTITESNIVDLNYIYIAGWMKAYYPEITIDWVRRNIGLELYTVLCGYIDKVFLSGASAKQQEPGTPKRTRKKRLS